MPTYKYRCSNSQCGLVSRRKLSFKDYTSTVICGRCKDVAKREVEMFGFAFKGGAPSAS